MKLREYRSPVNGRLEVWLINGKKTLEAESVNYSFASLHRVFQKAFKKSALSEKKIGKALILGFGAGSVARILRDEMALTCSITGVDADPLLFRIAEEDFDIHPDDRLLFISARAEKFMEENGEKYDLIVVDVFVNDRVPEAITTEAFLKKAADSLNQKGRLYFNLIVSHPQGMAQKEKVAGLMKAEGFKVNEFNYRDGNSVLWAENA